MIFLCFLLLLPLIEIALFAAIGGELGVFGTLLWCISAGFAGIFLMQYQGLKTTLAIQQALDRGDLPVGEVFDGICKFIAGIFLIVPGFFTDAIAVLLLIPAFRDIARRWAGRYFIGEPVHIRPGSRDPRREDAIDAEFTRVEPEADAVEPRRLS